MSANAARRAAEAARETDLEGLRRRRLVNWRQTPETRIRDADDGASEPPRLKLMTIYPVSPEAPNLYSAYMGDPEAKTEMKWDSPSGEVYTWRWIFGRRGVAFYANLVRHRPTLIAWDILPAALRLFADGRMPDELFDLGAISADAYRIAQALDGTSGALSTGELRKAAGFPMGKERRVAFQKALDELDRRFLLARTFVEGDGELRFALISERHREDAVAADKLSREAALDTLLRAYLPHAIYALPAVLARHLALPEEELRAGFERMVAAGEAEVVALPGQKGSCYASCR